MRIRSFTAIPAMLLLSLATSAAASETTSPGKKNAYTANEDVALNGVSITAAAATIEKGKAKTVIEIDASMTAFAHDNPDAVYFAPQANGFTDVVSPISGTFYGATQVVVNCDTGYFCSGSGIWWLDIDAAETAHPGAFVGQPIVISLMAGSNSSNAVADFTLRIRTQKK